MKEKTKRVIPSDLKGRRPNANRGKAIFLPGFLMLAAGITAGCNLGGGTQPTQQQTQQATQTVTREVPVYTTTFAPNPFTRSPAPVTLTTGGNTVSQSINADGSITLTISNAPGYEDDGIYFFVGQLRDFNSLQVKAAAGSGPFSANLWLDSNNDGDFFAWSPPNVYAGLGGDQYLLGPNSTNNVLTIDQTTAFGGSYTLAQLKSGALAGVTGSTIAGIWVGFALNSGSQTTTITGIQQQ